MKHFFSKNCEKITRLSSAWNIDTEVDRETEATRVRTRLLTGTLGRPVVGSDGCARKGAGTMAK